MPAQSRIRRLSGLTASVTGPRDWFALLSLVWLIVVIVAAIGADIFALYEFRATDLRARLQPPVWAGGTWAHPLGTDELGRDLFSRLLIATRVSLIVALIGTLIGAALGVALGFLAAQVKGLVDDAIMMLVDVQAALPYLIIALTVIAFFGNNLLLFVLLVGVYGWERYARLARGLALSAAERDYVVALRGFGAGNLYLYRRHILPNVASVLIVNMTLNFPESILLESSLSFLGLGIQPPLTSLGAMLGHGRKYLFSAWWIAVLPGGIIFLTSLSVSILGDRLRDRLDPTVKGT